MPVLDLGRFAGGLTPVSAHTDGQTKSLRLKGADGREYQFRSVDKDPTATLSPELQTTAVAKALRDGVSASFPAAAVIASALLQAVGVLHVDQTLAVMPDDSQLGAFRAEFKGVLGMIEERPSERAEEAGPYGGPRRVLSPTRAFALFDASPDDRADAHAFLRARLVDILMGDRDPAPRPVPVGRVRHGAPDAVAAPLPRSRRSVRPPRRPRPRHQPTLLPASGAVRSEVSEPRPRR